MKEKFLCDKHMYNFNAGCSCGVVMPEHVMKKIAKINCKYSNEVKKILNEYKDELYSSNWTLANKMDGDKIEKQVIIHYSLATDHDWNSVSNRIKLFSYIKPTYEKDFYVGVKDNEQAKEIAEEVLLEEL